MDPITSRELRSHTRELLDRVDAGDAFTITVDGRPVAVLHQVSRRPDSMPRDEFVRRVLSRQADSALRRDLRELRSGSTDEPLS